MRVLLLAVAGVAFVGCTFGANPCSADKPCPAGATCDPSGFCVENADSGPGGGGGSVGGGGGTTGGGGGTTGGGGGSAACGVCEEWQTCRPGVGCSDVTVSLVSPMNGDEFGAGGTVRMVVEVRDWDGGLSQRASIPASSISPGVLAPAVLTRDGGAFLGDFGLPSFAGSQTLTAGWPQANASVRVVTKACQTTCNPWEECVPNRDGGSCSDLGLQLTWTSPAVSEQFGPRDSAAIPLVLTVTRADAGPFGGTVPYLLVNRSQGVLTQMTGAWRGSVDAGADDGLRTIVAGWDAGPTPAFRVFQIVATPPDVQLITQAAPVRAVDDTDIDSLPRWKKNELALFQVESDRPMAAISPSDFTHPGVAASTSCTRPCAATKFCTCFGVDLARQPLVTVLGSISGTVSVGLQRATDLLGNVNNSISSQNFAVTRLKWRRDVSSTAGASPTAVALAPTGIVFAGASTSSAGLLRAFMPDGGLAWTNSYTTEAITAGPVVGTQGLYFAVANPGTSASIRRVGLSDGTGPSNPCFNSLSFSGDIALVSPGAGEVVLGVRSDGVLAPTTGSCIPAAISPSPGTPSAANRPTVVVAGTDAFVGMGQRAPIWKFTSTDVVPVAAGSKSTQTLFPANLFVVGTNLVGGGGGGGPTVGGVFAFLGAGALTGNTVNATPGTDPGGAAVVGGDTGNPIVFYGDSAGNQRRVVLEPSTPSFGTADAGLLNAAASFADRAAAVGRDGHLYVVGSDGTLRVLSTASLLEEWRWEAVFPTSMSQLNLDINRDSMTPCAAGQPGVLYLAASSGAATRLYAVLVDSAGLDRNAPWPRHQHDPANTGNASTSLSPWTCP